MNAAGWLVAAVLLCAAEVLSLDLVLLMLGGAALVTAGAALATDVLLPQLVVFGLTTLVLLAVVRPLARRHLEPHAVLAAGNDRLVARHASVVQHVAADTGQVRLDGELWRARAYSPGLELPAGSTAVVASVEGATLFVYPEELPP